MAVRTFFSLIEILSVTKEWIIGLIQISIDGFLNVIRSVSLSAYGGFKGGSKEERKEWAQEQNDWCKEGNMMLRKEVRKEGIILRNKGRERKKVLLKKEGGNGVQE